MDFPDILETERLTLRRPRPSDAGPMSLYVGDARVATMLARVPHPYPPGAAENFIARSLADKTAEHVWVMDGLKAGGPEFIGVVSLRPKGRDAVLGYWVGPPFWNTGYASEAAIAVVAAAREAGCARLTAEAGLANEASAHVLAHAGLVETGRGEAFVVALNEMRPVRLFTLDLVQPAAGAAR